MSPCQVITRIILNTVELSEVESAGTPVVGNIIRPFGRMMLNWESGEYGREAATDHH
jgi:hypothetical protein